MSVAGILEAARSDRPMSERLVWLCLENHANGHRFWSISIRDIAKEMHMRAATVVDAVKALIRDGIVRAQKCRRRATTYFMLRTYGPAENSVPEPVIQEPEPAFEPVTDTEILEPVLCSGDRNVDNPPSKYNPPDSDSPLASVFVETPDLFEPPEIQPDNVPEAEPVLQGEIEAPAAKPGSDQDPGFVAFWNAYPRKDDKGHARKAWAKAVRSTPPDSIIAGVADYPFNPNPRYIPLPATWLNGERWLAATEADTFDPVLRAAGLTPADFADADPNLLQMFR